MRLLYASMMLPYPPTFGKRMEIWSSLRALAAEGHETTLISFDDSGQRDVDTRPLAETCSAVELIPIQLSPPRSAVSYLGRLAALPGRAPFPARRFRSYAFEECIARHVAARRYDAIVCGEIFTSQNVPPSAAIPLVLKKDHIATTLVERYVECEKNPVKRAYGLLECLKTRAWEAGLCRRASVIMACSDYERNVLEQMAPGVPVTVAPNVIDLADYSVSGIEEDNTILYTGLMDWHPNQDAVLFFIESVLPYVRALLPGIRFVIAGRSTNAAFREQVAGVPNVEFLGTVSDMRPVISRAAVCVVPLRIGSGTRFKILEAAAMGRPVVSTTLGAEGLAFQNGREILLADEPREFASCVVSLLRDPTQRQRMAAAARLKVSSHYSFPVLRTAVRETLARLPTAAAAVVR